ncbi:DUF1648 domain-containing protein [Ureibacillus thermophilus]|uniref:DUF1648 domain-containing protein n=1 Tax=Ureibacillus thermophilus TaxID=367743 RepID=A0A4V1A361_9BACL|nr:DUF1648 domain-containing protein [Ureibacillus thermophilus]QBK26130.1 DUF1648 domain-containing protein [Ureibacillus thermophilus]
MKNPYRPILNIPKTKMEKIFDLIGISFFLLSILYIVIQWKHLPDQIPGHFNGKGEVDRWGSKYELFILPMVALFIFLLNTAFEKAPHMHNYPKRLNESNVEAFYLNSRKMLNGIKNLCMIFFAVLNVVIVQIGLARTDSLPPWLLPVFLIVVFIPLVVGLYKQSKIK